MKVFISWSGERSKAVAEALASWLRQVIQAIEPWVATRIPKGSRWGAEMSSQLEQAKVGIICLTRDNLTEPWILFEAGALSKTQDAVVCTFLLDLTNADVELPLAQFQHTTAVEEEVRKLIHTLNEHVQTTGERALPEADLDQVFDVFWPRLNAKLDSIAAPTTAMATEPVRSEGEILREILEIVRSLQYPSAQTPAGFLELVSEPVQQAFPYSYRILVQKRSVGEIPALVEFLKKVRPEMKVVALRSEANGSQRIGIGTPNASLNRIRRAIEELGIGATVKRLSKPARIDK